MQDDVTRRELVVALGSMSALVATPGCGLILYPERRGQPHSKDIDVLVAVVDGALCLVGLLPGIIAFAIDFSTGCIYWPDGRPSGQLNGRRLSRRTRRAYERALSEAVGLPIRLDDPALRFSSRDHFDAEDLLELADTPAGVAGRVALVEDELGEVVGFELS